LTVARYAHRFAYQSVLLVVLRHRRMVLVAAGIISLLFAISLPRLTFQTAIHDLMIQDLPETVAYHRFLRTFGSDELICVVIKADHVFETATFQQLTRLETEFAKIPGIRRIVGLATIKAAMDPRGQWALNTFATRIRSLDLFKRNFISNDEQTAMISLELATHADRHAVIKALDATLAGKGQIVTAYQIGMPVVAQCLKNITKHDFIILPPITMALVALALWVIFRNAIGLLAPMGTVFIVLLWTLGWMAWRQWPLSMLAMITPVFLIAVGTAYSMHIVFAFLHQAQRCRTAGEAVKIAFHQIYLPSSLAVFTTIAGMAVLLLSPIPAIVEMARPSIFGLAALLIALLIILPAALACLPRLPRRRPSVVDRIMQASIKRLIRLNVHGQRIVLPVFALIAIVGLVGIFQLKVDTNPISYLTVKNPVRHHFHDIYQHLSGSFPVNVVLTASEPDFFENPRHLAIIDRFQQFLASLPGVDKTVALPDYLRLVSYITSGFHQNDYALPQQPFAARMMINDFKTLLGTDLLDRFATPDFSQAHILMLTHLDSSEQFIQIQQAITAQAARILPPEISLSVTGMGAALSASGDRLTRSQVKSLSLNLLVVIGLMFFFFLSTRIALITLAVNTFPIIVTFGVMGLAGIEVSIASSLIAGIAISLAIDDTIHYLSAFNIEFQKAPRKIQSLQAALARVAPPIITTTIIVSLGFSVLMFSGFKPTAFFGMLMIISLVSALLGDLILLPVLMQHVELVTLWDLIRLKLGRTPNLSIPIFRNMTRSEVHYLLISATVRRLNTGQVLFRRGEPSKSMYALLSGAVDIVYSASSNKQNGNCALSRLGPGEIVGEMGLLRQSARNATVVAVGDCELLPIDWRMIKRLQWLYPPIAHKFFLNLMRTLCDRVESTSIKLSHVMDQTTGNQQTDRSIFMRLLEIERERSCRYDYPLSLCMFTFSDKNANEPVPPSINRQAIRIVTEHARQCDIACCLAPNRLAVIMPHTGLADAHEFGRRIRQDLSCGLQGAWLVNLDIDIVRHHPDPPPC